MRRAAMITSGYEGGDGAGPLYCMVFFIFTLHETKNTVYFAYSADAQRVFIF
jgi:hypothetical protein